MSDPRYHILMSDVIRAGATRGATSWPVSAGWWRRATKTWRRPFFPPLTITLGDEFPGVMASPRRGLRGGSSGWRRPGCGRGFLPRLRYVIVLGEIETELNREIAHGMVGAGADPGAGAAHRQKRARPEVALRLGDPYLERQLGALFQLMLAISQGWRPADYGLVAAMLGRPRDREVAELFGKDPSQIWRRTQDLADQGVQPGQGGDPELLAREGAGCRAGR